MDEKTTGDRLVYDVSKAKIRRIRREIRVKGEARKRLKRVIRHPHRIKRFEVHTAMMGLYEIRARLANGQSVCLGSDKKNDDLVNGLDKIKIAKKMVQILNRNWRQR